MAIIVDAELGLVVTSKYVTNERDRVFCHEGHYNNGWQPVQGCFGDLFGIRHWRAGWLPGP